MYLPMIKSEDNRSVNNRSCDLTACVLMLLLSSTLVKDGITHRANVRSFTSMPNLRKLKVKAVLRCDSNMREMEMNH